MCPFEREGDGNGGGDVFGGVIPHIDEKNNIYIYIYTCLFYPIASRSDNESHFLHLTCM